MKKLFFLIWDSIFPPTSDAAIKRVKDREPLDEVYIYYPEDTPL